MFEIGSVIRARATRVEPYGLYLEHAGERVVVLAPEISWKPSGDLRQAIRLGDEYDLLILRYNYRDRCFVGSLRRVHPEENPYRDLSRLAPRTTLRGKVINAIAGEATVELANGAWGRVPIRELSTTPTKGDELDVMISALEVDEASLTLAPAAQAAPASDRPSPGAPTIQPA